MIVLPWRSTARCLLCCGLRKPANTTTKLTLQVIKAGINLASPYADLSGLLFQATKHAHTLASALVDAGFAQPALPFAVHATLAMEAHTKLRLPRFLAWRCELAALVCRAYSAMAAPALAKRFIARLTQDIGRLESTLQFDPVPHSASFRTQIDAAKKSLAALLLQFPTAESDFTASSLESLLDTLMPAGRRVLDRAPPPAALSGASAALVACLMPLVATLQDEILAKRSQAESVADGDADGGNAAKSQDAGVSPAESGHAPDTLGMSTECLTSKVLSILRISVWT